MKSIFNNSLLAPAHVPKKPCSREPLELLAPDIEVAFHDADTPGLIPISALNAPLTMTFKVWPGAIKGYGYQLCFNGKNSGPIGIILDSHTPGDILTLDIPTELLTEGFHNVQYMVVNPTNQVEEYSTVFRIQIDKTPPGAPELAAIQFPAEVQNGLTAAELENLGGKLDVQIAGYTIMRKHDLIQTWWGGVKGPTAIVNEDDMGLNKVVVTFTRDFLASVGEGEHLVCYQVFDRAGNPSMFSNAVPLTLRLQEIPLDYPAPVIDSTVGDLIDYVEAQTGVLVDIPHYSGAAALDHIQLFWGDNNPLLPVILPDGDENEDIVMTLRVPFEVIALQPEGKVRVHYEVSRREELVGTSLSTEIDVFANLPFLQPLESLIVQGTSVENPNKIDNFIDEDDYELSGRGIVTWNDGLAIGDDLNLHWGDQTKPQWYQIRSSDLTQSKDLILPIDGDIIRTQGTGAAIPVYFTVTRSGNPNPVVAPMQHVVVRSKEEQPGGPDGLNGPTFNLTSNGVLGPNENPDGAWVTIAPYINIAEGQRINFTFKGFDVSNNPIEAATYTATRKLDEVEGVEGYAFKVPYINTRLICTGFAEASYTVNPVEDSNQSPANSVITRVVVNMLSPSEITCLTR
ncbi:hypothetical protein BZK31_05870 [Pseudomonas floridensis]|uniref:Uncharacterized protein n=1 Tax=Pseudomonas floridensis TaxID=1958950 RepID=A0A1X0NB76_9PSED|nr:hypothetical protein [Pseudomonas floridensis]ORC60662.1 hypothetical protein BZK31_05870 [Pseudomonas floridensis]